MRKLVRSEEERRYRRDRDHERKWKRISDACEREMNAEVGKHSPKSMAAISAGMSSRVIWLKTESIGAWRATKTASARSLSSCASATVTLCRPCSAPRAKRNLGLRLALPRERSSTPTKHPHGMACTARSK